MLGYRYLRSFLGALAGIFCLLGLSFAQAPDQVRPQSVNSPSMQQAEAARPAAGAGGDAAALLARARELDLAGSPERLEAYARALEAASASPADAQPIRRRLVLLYLLAGRQKDAQRMLEDYRTAGGLDFTAWSAEGTDPLPTADIEVPGPLLAFQRMAAIRPDTSIPGVLPALAGNIATFGYDYSTRTMRVEATEYLKLLKSYLVHERALEALAGPEGVLRAATCEQALPIIKAVGYRLRGQGCAAPAQTELEVEDASRAFLANNSGFPVGALEQAVHGSQPFEYSVKPVRLPVILGPEAWNLPAATWVDALLDSRETSRLYAAFSHLESHTAMLLQQRVGIGHLKVFAPVLDFYGSMIRVDERHHVEVPGGREAVGAWRQIAGASPDQGAAFLTALLARDSGWLAAYFDVLWRATPAQRAYLCQPLRLVRFYHALVGKNPEPGPARPIFRANALLMLLATRLRISPAGEPQFPGGLKAWEALLRLRVRTARHGKPELSAADQVVEALFANARRSGENTVVNVFLALNEVDRPRSTPLGMETALVLAAQYPRFSQHYSLLAGWPQLSDAGILKLIDAFETLGRIHDTSLRADALGSFQALLSLCDIMSRQKEIPEAQTEPFIVALGNSFSRIDSSAALFDAARGAAQALLMLTGKMPGGGMQERMVQMLAGPDGLPAEAQQVREHIARRLRLGMDSQRLLSLDTLCSLADALRGARQHKLGDDFRRQAAEIKELAVPRMFASVQEQNSAIIGRATEQHIAAERDTDLAPLANSNDTEKIARARGQLAPFLRDTLVGFVYAYYAPPGSELLANNPLFVRSHDFLGNSGTGQGNEVWGPGRVTAVGWPYSAGGRFVGSLSGIAYALADAEKDFLVPLQTQSLIWSEVAPQILISSIVPRWWGVSMHTERWVGLHMRLARDLFAEAAVSPNARRAVIGSLEYVSPRRAETIQAALASGDVLRALALVTPAELYRSASVLLAGRAPKDFGAGGAGPAAAELQRMALAYPEETSPVAVSAAFGVPHPRLARSFRPELLDVPLYPTLMGYSSRLLAESWESANLYWAEVADELHVAPPRLNQIVPDLTRHALERVFANDLDDWPALMQAMNQTGDEFRRKTLALAHATPATPSEIATTEGSR